MHCALCGHRAERKVCEACTLVVARGIVQTPELADACWGPNIYAASEPQQLAFTAWLRSRPVVEEATDFELELAARYAQLGLMSDAVHSAAVLL